MIIEIFELLFTFLCLIMLAYLVRHYIFTITVLNTANRPKKAKSPLTNFEPSVTIMIPAKNEEKVIGRLLERITELTYPKNKLQVIVINDASSDNTGKLATEYKNQYTFIEVLNRDPASGGRGKAAAMNEGFSKSEGEIILCFDADYYPQRDIVERLSSAFIDPNVGAVQGRVVVLNEPESTITRLVALERVGGYRIDQEARDNLGLITQFAGTVGGFRSSVLKDLHGWDESVLAEDTDLTFRIYLAGYTVKYDVKAECYEEAVNNWRAYWRQRYRWAKGHMQCFFKHSLNVLKTDKLNAKQKIDGTLLLNVYFMPIIASVSFIVGLYLLLFHEHSLFFASVFWFMVPISLYSFVGNFAPFFEVGVGLYLDGRKRTQWLIPLSLFTFLYNVPICTLAFVDVVFSKIKRKNNSAWSKTNHSGNGHHNVNRLTLKADAIWD
jgi:cellulose synthase/poly-beta-1,6-N-acetylglucosamine synthase-like glycosyltransferase